MAEWYDAYLKSDHWQQTRLKRLLAAELDNEFNVIRCEGQECRMWFPLGLIQVHHNTYERVGKELPTDLNVFCGACHGVEHQFPRPHWWESLKKQNSQMVTMASYRHLSQIKKIGEVVFECLQFHRVIS